MKTIGFLSNLAVPFTIFLIVTYGLIEKRKVFDLFIEGAKEGIEIVVKIFPTLIGFFLAIGLLRSSGVLDFLVKLIMPITNLLHIPSEIMPLALLRPISRKWLSFNGYRYNGKVWGRQSNRFNNFYNYGLNRNHTLYNSTIY